MGIAACAAAAAADRRRQPQATHPLTATPRPRDRPAAGHAGRARLSSTWSAPALGGRPLRSRRAASAARSSARPACICGFVADADDVSSSAPEPHAATRCRFPVPGTCAQMQSNMAATLNIDWLLDLAREAADSLGTSVDRPATCSRARRRGRWSRSRARRSTIPTSTRPASAGPSSTRRPRPVHRPLDAASASPASCAPSTRASPSPPAIATRAMGRPAEEVRLAGGAARSPVLRRSSPACSHAGARRGARGGRRCRRGDDGAPSRSASIPDMAACCRDLGRSAPRERARQIPRSCASTDGCSSLSQAARRHAAGLARSRRHRPAGADAGGVAAMTVLRSPSSATVSCSPTCFARRSARAARCRNRIRTLELPWPDEPMHHGYATARGLRRPARSIFGDPDDIVAFIDDAEIFVTHLAPVSTPMLDRGCRS